MIIKVLRHGRASDHGEHAIAHVHKKTDLMSFSERRRVVTCDNEMLRSKRRSSVPMALIQPSRQTAQRRPTQMPSGGRMMDVFGMLNVGMVRFGISF